MSCFFTMKAHPSCVHCMAAWEAKSREDSILWDRGSMTQSTWWMCLEGKAEECEDASAEGLRSLPDTNREDPETRSGGFETGKKTPKSVFRSRLTWVVQEPVSLQKQREFPHWKFYGHQKPPWDRIWNWNPNRMIWFAKTNQWMNISIQLWNGPESHTNNFLKGQGIQPKTLMYTNTQKNNNNTHTFKSTDTKSTLVQTLE